MGTLGIILSIIVIIYIVFRLAGRAETTLTMTEKKYWNARRNYPGLDEHQYLAMVYKGRSKVRSKIGWEPNKEEVLFDLAAYSYTVLFSVLPPPDSIRALALHIVYQEDQNYLRNNPQLIEEYNQLTSSIHKMVQEQPDQFSDLYKKRNPNSASYYDTDILTHEH